MKWDRTLLTIYVGWILLVAILSPLLATEANIDTVRFFLTALFGGGAVTCVIGYFRYIGPGPTMPAFLGLLICKSIAFALLGIGFFVVAIGSNSAGPPTTATLITFSLFGAAGAAMFFIGMYVLIGKGRGWITREVYKFPWKTKRSQDAKK